MSVGLHNNRELSIIYNGVSGVVQYIHEVTQSLPKIPEEPSSSLFQTIGKKLLHILKLPIPALFVATGYTLVVLATTIICKTEYAADSFLRPNPSPHEEPHVYDFIIVGGGSAGAVLANRLSSNSQWRVLLLEAGGPPTLLNSIPGLLSFNLYHKETDWSYFSEPQRNCGYASLDQKIGLTRGKSLGGSSNLNLMMYQRGNKNDFDNWANITGDPSWRYENLLKYFKMSENYRGNFPDQRYHGSDGRLTVSKLSYEPLVKEWVAGGEEFGLNTTDPNGDQTSTFSPVESTIKNGRRAGTYDAYLRHVMDRSNLKIVRYAMVDRVLLSDKKAYGVVYTRHGETMLVKAKKEIILSAGVFGSPSILQRSGIGGRKLLKELKIPVVHDLPGVGEGLQDHVMTIIGPILINSSVSLLLDDVASPSTLLEYVVKGTGPLSFNAVSGVGFFSTSSPKRPDWPNICTFLSPFGIHSTFARDFEILFALRRGILEPFVQGLSGRHAVQALINLGHPASRGWVKIASKDPNVPPLIDPNYYGDPGEKDISAMVEAFQFMVEYFTNTTTWKRLGANPTPRHFPGCEKFELQSKDYYECHIRHYTGSSFHSCCTNQMGPDDSKMAVVDSELRVRGLKNLRVIDSSVLPVITNANLNAPTVAIAEKIASAMMHEWMTE